MRALRISVLAMLALGCSEARRPSSVDAPEATPSEAVPTPKATTEVEAGEPVPAASTAEPEAEEVVVAAVQEAPQTARQGRFVLRRVSPAPWQTVTIPAQTTTIEIDEQLPLGVGDFWTWDELGRMRIRTREGG